MARRRRSRDRKRRAQRRAATREIREPPLFYAISRMFAGAGDEPGHDGSGELPRDPCGS